jgi:hypothetical protein
MIMDKIFSNKIFSGLAVALALFSAMPAAQAALATYNYTITGDVYVGDETFANAYGLTAGDTVTATGTFTADLGTIGNETGTVLFATGSGNTMSIDLNGTIFTAADDDGFLGGIGPYLIFDSGSLFDFDFQKTSEPKFNSSFSFFDNFNESESMFGEWTDLNLTVVPTVVPVPAAVWLFGSGLLGLVGLARRGKVKHRK